MGYQFDDNTPPLAERVKSILADNPTSNSDGRYSEDELWELAAIVATGFTADDLAFEVLVAAIAEDES